MRLASYSHPSRQEPSLGVLLNDEFVLDLPSASDGWMPNNLRDFLRLGSPAFAKAEALAADYQRRQSTDGQLTDGRVMALADIRLLPPISDPGKILCVALNFQSHIDECQAYGMDFIQRTPFPLLAPKMPNTLIGHEGDVVYPEGGEQLDYEVELAFIISRHCRNVKAADWRDYVAGFTLSTDLCLREIAFKPFGVFEGKNYDGFLPLGPYLVTPDEAPSPHEMVVTMHVNGEQRQKETMANAFFNVGEVLEYWSARMTLEAGDVFTLGTPAGVGIFHENPHTMLLKPGDVIESAVEGLGVLRNRIVSHDS